MIKCKKIDSIGKNEIMGLAPGCSIATYQSSLEDCQSIRSYANRLAGLRTDVSKFSGSIEQVNDALWRVEIYAEPYETK